MAIIRSAKKPFWHILPKEEGTENPGRFHLKPMSVEVERHLTSMRMDGKKQCDTDILKAALIEWENIPIPGHGNAPIERDEDGLVTDETLEILELDERADLAQAVLRGGKLSETDEKNSEPSSDNTSVS